MIRYRLQCQKSHQFEAWFPSSKGYDDQVSRGLVACPKCGSKKVEKALMAPNVVTSERKVESRAKRRGRRAKEAVAGPPADEAQLVMSGKQREMLNKLREIRDKVLAEAEYVGPRFAEEARKIHDEESEARGIYGEASAEEVKDLLESGIDVLPVPVLPDDQN